MTLVQTLGDISNYFSAFTAHSRFLGKPRKDPQCLIMITLQWIPKNTSRQSELPHILDEKHSFTKPRSNTEKRHIRRKKLSLLIELPDFIAFCVSFSLWARCSWNWVLCYSGEQRNSSNRRVGIFGGSEMLIYSYMYIAYFFGVLCRSTV